MSTHTNDGNGNITITSTGNYDINGSVTQVSVFNQPTQFFLGNTIASLLANITLALRIQGTGGAITIENVNMLDFLGNRADMVVTYNGESESLTISASSLFQDNPVFPDPQDVTDTFTISFTNWEYNNTLLGTTPLLSFSITQDVHKRAFIVNGQTTLDSISAPTQFYAYGYRNVPSDYIGSLLDLFEQVSVDLDEDGTINTYTLRELAEFGYNIKTDKESDFGSLGLDVLNETQSATNYFKHIDTSSETTTITMVIPCYDADNDTDFDLELSFSLVIAGIISASVSINDFMQGIGGIISSRARFTNGGTTTDFQVPSELENYYSSSNYAITNLDTQTSATNILTDLTNGHYQVDLNLVINPQYTQTYSGTFNVYQESVSSIVATLVQNQFRVGTVFKDSNIQVVAKHLIYDSDYFDETIYYPNFSSDYNNVRFTLDDVPSVTITVTYQGNTYQVVATIYNYSVDELWVYNKITLRKNKSYEIQQNFNMNFVIDETKDSARVVVFSHDENEITPNTICYHVSTDTWWICKSDKVTRYDSERNALYKHEIYLIGAIELLNSRDLVNCGFNVNHYTIGSFITRLIQLTDLEMPVVFNLGNYMNITTKIDYLKTFANYTPLSALKEFFNGYNMNIKMLFETIGNGASLDRGVIYLIPNNGTDNTPIDIDTFNSSEEMITIDRENYGSRVISNIQNCVSGKSIRYPSVGTCNIGSTGDKVENTNGIIRLPSKANYVESLEICGHYYMFVDINDNAYYGEKSTSDVYDETEFERVFQNIISQVNNNVSDPLVKNAIVNAMTSGKDFIKKRTQEECVIKLVNGADYDITTQQWNGKQVQLAYKGSPTQQTDGHPGIGIARSNSIGLNDKRHYDTFPTKPCLIYWEQGSDLIQNFEFFIKFTGSQNETTYKYIGGYSDVYILQFDVVGEDELTYSIKVWVGMGESSHSELSTGIGYINNYQATYVVHYVPMADIRVKSENGIMNNDSVLYNQNGTLVGAKAVSKLINSHATSISSSQLTRYKRYYDFFSVPSVGQLVKSGNTLYVINNVSIDFAENDNNGYALDCVFTMTKQIACKSAMVSANTNIRDYDTPQNNNIVRQQNYRDVISLAYSPSTSQALWYNISYLTKLANAYELGASKGFYDNHTALIRVVSDSDYWYYQVPSVKYELERMVVEVIDFKDNNIIAYGTQQTTHPFQFTSWWVANDLANVPISYVDEYGELDSITIQMVDNEQLTEGYEYIKANYPSVANIPSLYSFAGLIPYQLFNHYTSSNRDMYIDESNYLKDGLEIPVFVYSCQIFGRTNINIAGDFFDSEKLDSDNFYCYFYKLVDNPFVSEQVANTIIANSDLPTINNGVMTITNELEIATDNASQYKFNLYDSSSVNLSTMAKTSGNLYTSGLKGKTVVIYRCRCSQTLGVAETKFVMALNNIPYAFTNGYITLYKIGYKLK